MINDYLDTLEDYLSLAGNVKHVHLGGIKFIQDI
jgi:hypothetical protein